MVTPSLGWVIFTRKDSDMGFIRYKQQQKANRIAKENLRQTKQLARMAQQSTAAAGTLADVQAEVNELRRRVERLEARDHAPAPQA